VVVPLAAVLAPSVANAATTATCTGAVAVTGFAFNPPSIPLGSSSPLTLVLQNCTSQAIQGSTDWFGAYSGQGCPVLDAIPFAYSIAAGGTYTLTNTFGDPGLSRCQPTALRMSANVNVNGAGTVTTVTATLQFTAACPNGIAIRQFSFNPPSVPVGQTSTLTLVLQNCSSQAEQGTSIFAGRFTGAGTGIPPGCPAIDPVGFGYSLAPGATATQTLGMGDPVASCLATGLQATVNVNVNGVTGTAATATANLVITSPAPGGCHVSYTPSNWQGGFTASVTITNFNSLPVNGWTLTFTFPGDQKITNAWNATVTQTGASVTAANLAYNNTIPGGGSQSFGFQGTWATSDTTPASFTLNGTACT
jgi:cellulase/cellobiase CelA1